MPVDQEELKRDAQADPALTLHVQHVASLAEEGATPEEIEEKAGRFEVKDRGEVNRVISRIREMAERHALEVAFYEEEAFKLRTWLGGRQRAARHEIAYFAKALEAFARAEHEADPKSKTWTLPEGTVSLHKAKPKWTWPTDGQLVKALREMDAEEFVGSQPIPKKQEIKDKCAVAGGHPVLPSGEMLEVVGVEELDAPEFRLKLSGKDVKLP